MYSATRKGSFWTYYGIDLFIFFCSVLVFIGDLFTPLGKITWVLYIAVAGLSLIGRSYITTLLIALFSSLYLVLGYLWTAPGGDLEGVILNRSLGGVTLWIITIAVLRSKHFEYETQKDAQQRRLEAELSRIMSGELELESTAKSTLKFFVEKAHALVGAMYILEEDGKLRLIESVGIVNPKKEYALNEGLVGRQATEFNFTHLKSLPKDYFKIESASGETQATEALLIPATYGDSIRGVLEIGTYGHFPESIIKFSDRVRDLLGQGVVAGVYARDLRIGLEERSRQAEILQAQQEELRVTNEELEAQSTALKESQVQLETQTAELEQQQALLEEKNDELEARNSELQAIRKELEQGTRELAEANRYKSEFLSNMSHELRTPINSMLILSQLLSENKNGNLNQEQVDFAKTITSSGNDLLNLINEILDLSKVEAGMMEVHIEATYPTEVLDRMRRYFAPMAEGKGLKFKINNELPSDSVLKTDSKRLEQILKNLLSNALKFTKQGSVTLSVEQNETGQFRFSVEDTGAGIPESKQKSIFRAFEQGDGTIARRYGGTGLGLSIVKELTALLGGTIDLESEEGVGSKFILTLPAETTGNTDRKPDSKSGAQMGSFKRVEPPKAISTSIEDFSQYNNIEIDDDRSSITESDRSVVIIEDDIAFAKTLIRMARELGFKVVSSFTGQQGIEFIEKYKPSAILLDMRLPDTNGLTVLEYVKGSPSLRHIPVHVVSAVSYEQNALAMGAIGYLQKPTSVEEIRGAFKKVSEIISKEIKYVLIVEDDPVQRGAIEKLVESPEVKTIGVGDAKSALKVLEEQSLDCMIIDLRLPDASGLELLQEMSEIEGMQKPPVIVYTGKELSRAEEEQLKRYSESIIIKGARSPERLLAETTLFLHRVEKDLPQEKQKMLRAVRERSDALTGRTVLLVDDDMRNVFALSAALEGAGLKVIAARNGKEAITKLHQNDKIEGILMDIMMPEMDGFEAMRRIRSERRYSNLPIIALTAKAMKGDDIRCLEAGANDYLSKPVDLDKLLSLLRVWLSSVGGF